MTFDYDIFVLLVHLDSSKSRLLKIIGLGSKLGKPVLMPWIKQT